MELITTQNEIKQIVTKFGAKPFVAKQITDWLYKKRVHDIEEMTNISKSLRETLTKKCTIGLDAPVWSARSVDGTSKYLFETSHGPVETVFIPDENRGTLCVSCQVGCKMNCQFCMTGKQGWNGNLTVTEIMNQIMSVPESKQLTNIVFMGMGEPMDNLDEVMKAIEILTSEWGFGWSPHRITVSTVGIIPAMERFLKESECHLAISMHNPFSEERSEIMPIEKRYPISEVIDIIRKYDWTHQRRVSFEYILISGHNDTPRHTAEIIKLTKGLECRVNLIRWHAIPGQDLHSPDEVKMVAFRDRLSANGTTCTIRRSRGEDIQAACGLLSSNHKHI
ncbi:MAG: 23S rRNA (adenine(2503)-C(2))-methyltransferase RlmN [Paludibacteraceae bacterium]|nr:23S rRNA (adenine(2503)-C(2))-methyltransferase RlmN [Paludibacteraceae bacterium]